MGRLEKLRRQENLLKLEGKKEVPKHILNKQRKIKQKNDPDATVKKVVILNDVDDKIVTIDNNDNNSENLVVDDKFIMDITNLSNADAKQQFKLHFDKISLYKSKHDADILNIMCYKNNVELANYILDLLEESNKLDMIANKNLSGDSALMWCCKHNATDLAIRMIDLNNKCTQTVSNSGLSPLLLSQCPIIMKKLLSQADCKIEQICKESGALDIFATVIKFKMDESLIYIMNYVHEHNPLFFVKHLYKIADYAKTNNVICAILENILLTSNSLHKHNSPYGNSVLSILSTRGKEFENILIKLLDLKIYDLTACSITGFYLIDFLIEKHSIEPLMHTMKILHKTNQPFFIKKLGSVVNYAKNNNTLIEQLENILLTSENIHLCIDALTKNNVLHILASYKEYIQTIYKLLNKNIYDLKLTNVLNFRIIDYLIVLNDVEGINYIINHTQKHDIQLFMNDLHKIVEYGVKNPSVKKTIDTIVLTSDNLYNLVNEKGDNVLFIFASNNTYEQTVRKLVRKNKYDVIHTDKSNNIIEILLKTKMHSILDMLLCYDKYEQQINTIFKISHSTIMINLYNNKLYSYLKICIEKYPNHDYNGLIEMCCSDQNWPLINWILENPNLDTMYRNKLCVPILEYAGMNNITHNEREGLNIKKIQSNIENIYKIYQAIETKSDGKTCIMCGDLNHDSYVIEPCCHVLKIHTNCVNQIKVNVGNCVVCSKKITSMKKCFIV